MLRREFLKRSALVNTVGRLRNHWFVAESLKAGGVKLVGSALGAATAAATYKTLSATTEMPPVKKAGIAASAWGTVSWGLVGTYVLRRAYLHRSAQAETPVQQEALTRSVNNDSGPDYASVSCNDAGSDVGSCDADGI